MLKKTILVTLFLSFNKSYSMNLWNKLKNLANDGIDATKKIFKGEKKEGKNNENKSEENKKSDTTNKESNTKGTTNKDSNTKGTNKKDLLKTNNNNKLVDDKKNPNNNKQTETNKSEEVQMYLKIKDIENYKYYDKINKDIRDILKVEKNKEKIIEIKINKTDNNEDKIKNKIITKLNIGNFIKIEDIVLNLEKKHLKIFTTGDNSFIIKNLIITDIIDPIEKCLKDLECEINEKNINNYKDNFKKFKEKIENLKNNKFYSEYYKELKNKYNGIKEKIEEYFKNNLTHENKTKLNEFTKQLNERFNYIKKESFTSFNENEIEEIKNIHSNDSCFEEIVKKIKGKIKNIDDILDHNIDIIINNKKEAILEHIKKFLTIIEFKIKDNKKLSNDHGKIFKTICDTYKKGVFEYVSNEDIKKIFDKLKFNKIENYKYEDITYNDNNRILLEKGKPNTIYVEFPVEYYQKDNENEDEEEDIEEENEEVDDSDSKEQADENKVKDTSTTSKTKKKCSSYEKNNKEKPKTTKNGGVKKTGCCNKNR